MIESKKALPASTGPVFKVVVTWANEHKLEAHFYLGDISLNALYLTPETWHRLKPHLAAAVIVEEKFTANDWEFNRELIKVVEQLEKLAKGDT